MRITSTLFFLSLGMLSLSAGQQESPLDLLDENDDGKLSFREFAKNKSVENVPIGRVRELYGRLDRDNDGFLAGEEVRTPKINFKQAPAERMFVPMGKMMKKADVNQDDFLSFQEYITIPYISELGFNTQKDQFRRMDTNLDQKLTLMELSKARKANDKGFVEQIDADQDGVVTIDEFEASRYVRRLKDEQRKRMFKNMDHNKDGILNQEDFAK